MEHVALGDINDNIDLKNTARITISEDEVFYALETVLSFRCKETSLHSKRTSKYAHVLVQRMLKEKQYKYELIRIDYESIIQVMRIHDIGKIGIGDNILFKPEHLNTQEFEKIKSHVESGVEILNSILAGKQTNSRAIQNCRDIIRYHHERWDGKGYLEGISGEQIPLSARIAAVADVYDAVTSSRSYKKANSHTEAVEIIKAGAGSHFDPDIVDCFLDITQHFKMVLENRTEE